MNGVANIELKNIYTGEIINIEEHNHITDIFEDIMNSNCVDGYMKYDTVMKKYLNTIVIQDETPTGKNNLMEDNINIIDTKNVSYNGFNYGDNGVEYIFEFGENEANGLIRCLSLAHNNFEDPTTTFHKNGNLVSGSVQYNLNGLKSINIVNADYEKNEFISLYTDYLSTGYNSTNPFNIYIQNYFHDFNQLVLSQYLKLNMRLLRSTNIDIKYMFEGITNPFSNNSKLYYAIDEENKKVIVFYINKEVKVFNTCVIDLENTSNVVFHNMSINENVDLLISPSTDFNGWGAESGYITFLANVYNTETKETKNEIIGINYEDSTDIKEFETIFVEEVNTMSLNRPLLNLENGTLICEHLCIKNNKAYVYENHSLCYGFLYKSKIIKFTGNGNILRVAYEICPYVLSTINKMSKTITKTKDYTMKITYRITQKEN